MLTLNKLLLGGVILLLGLGAIGVAGYLYLSSVEDNVTPPLSEYVERVPFTEEELYDEMLSSIDQNEQIKGSIFITSGLKAKPSTGSFAYDLANDDYVYLPTSPDDLYFHLNKSDEADVYIFKGRFTEFLGEEWYNPELFVQDASGRRTVTLGEPAESFYRLSLPRVSPDGEHFVYSSKSWSYFEDEPRVEDIGAWNIYVGAREADEPTELFATGHGAHWLPGSDYVLYIKEGGVYARIFSEGADHVNQPEHLLISDLNVYGTNNHFNVSADGRYLVITQPVHADYGNPHVDIYRIDIEEDMISATKVHRLVIADNGGAYWPMFSPGGRYLSMQTRHVLPDTTEDNHIRIYDLVTREFVHEIDFNDADFDAAFNTDWVAEFDASSLAI